MNYALATLFIMANISLMQGETSDVNNTSDDIRLLSSIAVSSADQKEFVLILTRKTTHETNDWGQTLYYYNYLVSRHRVEQGVPNDVGDVVWTTRLPGYLPGRPLQHLRSTTVFDMDVSLDNKTIYLVMGAHHFPVTKLKVYEFDPFVTAKDMVRNSQPQQRSEPFVEYIDENIHKACGIERVRLIAGRKRLRLFVTRGDGECDEEEILYDMGTGEWTPAPTGLLSPTQTGPKNRKSSKN